MLRAVYNGIIFFKCLVCRSSASSIYKHTYTYIHMPLHFSHIRAYAVRGNGCSKIRLENSMNKKKIIWKRCTSSRPKKAYASSTYNTNTNVRWVRRAFMHLMVAIYTIKHIPRKANHFISTWFDSFSVG